MQNPLKLSFEKEHKSIKSLPDTEVPRFLILTGVNGCGKTHLLQAIDQGAVKVEGIESKMHKIRIYDSASFSVKINASANAERSRHQINSDVQNIHSKIYGLNLEIIGFIKSRRIYGKPELTDAGKLLSATEADLEDIFRDAKVSRQGSADAIALAKEFGRFRDSKIDALVHELDNSYLGLGTKLRYLAEDAGKPLFTVSQAEVKICMPVVKTRQDLLQLQLADWFVSWHELWEQNRYHRYLHRSEGVSNRTYIPLDEDFISLYGEQPWIVVNRVLERSGLPYRFNHPEIDSPAFALRLINDLNGDIIEVDSLSDGEKILLAIIVVVHQGNSSIGVLSHKPSLLLLDEIDAPLHPSFTRSLLKTIEEELVKKLDMAVIMTTHSPSTVALAPEGSVFELKKYPREIRAVNKSQAIQILSSGFISVTPNDTIVITESSADSNYYQKIFQGLVRAGTLQENPSLRFLAASAKLDDGRGGGCAQVQNWAPKLGALGLSRFRGLIDRDDGNPSSSSIKVINRYCVENYVFDPVILTSFLLHRGLTAPFEGSQNLRSNAGFLISLKQEERQLLLDCFLSWLAKSTGQSLAMTSLRYPTSYVGLGTLNIPSWWIDSKKDEILKTIRPQLNSLSTAAHRGAIISKDRDEIVEFASSSFPEAIPLDLVDTFRDLQSQ